MENSTLTITYIKSCLQVGIFLEKFEMGKWEMRAAV